MLSAFFDRTQQQQQQQQQPQPQQQQQQQPQQLQGQRAVKAALRTFRAFKNILSASLLPVLGLPSFICDRIHYLPHHFSDLVQAVMAHPDRELLSAAEEVAAWLTQKGLQPFLDEGLQNLAAEGCQLPQLSVVATLP